jgi:quercetin dioxygenase-like cupin family protein
MNRSGRFDVRTVTIAPGGERRFHEPEWRDALVFVERGQIELASASGASERFGRGDLLWLTGLPLLALRNRRPEPAVLVAVSRATDVSPGDRAPPGTSPA